MTLDVDVGFLPKISYRFRNFRRKGNYLWNFSCPICGDSKTNTFKARGYLYRQKDGLFFHCHNCGISTSFSQLVKKVDPQLYKEYLFDNYKKDEKVKPLVFTDIIKPPVFKERAIDLPSVASLSDKHYAKQYCVKRLIPKKYFNELYFSEDYEKFVNEIKPDNDKKLIKNDRRLVIPFYDDKNKLVAFQGRALYETDARYITIKLDESGKKIFGLNTVNLFKRIYVLEGPIDSMFLDNAIATADAALYSVVGQLGYDLDYCFIYDNEPRSKECLHNMKKTIEMGYSVCVWPSELVNFKDINQMILGGYTPSLLQSIIDTRTFSGMNALLEISQWTK